MTNEPWITLAEAVHLIGNATGKADLYARLTLCEWLGDGLLSARVDGVIEHQLIEFKPVVALADPTGVVPLGQPLHAWELPTKAVIHDAQLLDAAFWTPAPPGVEHHELWSTGQITCADGNGTRARRVYVGVKVERSKLSETAQLYGYNISEAMLLADDEGGRDIAPLSDRTGGAGAPSSMHIITEMMRERIAQGINNATMATEAEELIRLFAKRPDCSGLRTPTAKTICNSLGQDFRRLRSIPE
jgi:hypothetical protein